MKDAGSQEQIDDLIARFFSVFDNRKGSTPTLIELVACFTEKAIIVRRGDSGAEIYTLEEFAFPRVALLTHGALRNFHEHEISATTQLFDGIATHTSRYAKSGVLDGKEYSGSGTKCFQLVEAESGWRIAALAWVDDNA